MKKGVALKMVHRASQRLKERQQDYEVAIRQLSRAKVARDSAEKGLEKAKQAWRTAER